MSTTEAVLDQKGGRVAAKTVFFLALIACTLIGGGALIETFLARSRLMDTNLTQLVPWGLGVTMYIYFIGLSAGSFLISSLIYVFKVKRFEEAGRVAVFQAIICLMVGGGCILLDLGHPERMWRLIVNWNPTSLLAWMAVFYTLYILILLPELYLLLREDLIAQGKKAGIVGRIARLLALGKKDLTEENKAKGSKTVILLAMIGIPVAICVHGGTGALFAVVKARPIWYTGLFPFVFLVSAVVSGGGLLTFLMAFFSKSGRKNPGLIRSLAVLTAGVLCLDLFLLVAESLVTFYGGIPDHAEAYAEMFFGPYAFVFWGFQIFLGAAIPLFIVLHPKTKNHVTWLGIGGLLIVIGIIAVRLNIIIPPLIQPEFSSLPDVYHQARWLRGYFPSLSEWLTNIGIVAIGVWAFILGKWLLPLEHVTPEEN
ncbi:MAG: polysulfide reductase NrfD [Planctomycetes bacterium]|nr:polysulfide reductase NrfD [Planctomycetota bacterium]